MKILIAPDKFKGSLSASQVCDAITKGIKINKSKHKIVSCPMADGGEGSIDIINNYLSLKPVDLIVNDPLFRPIKSTYYYSELTAYIEMSLASGLNLLKKEEQNCMNTSSFGTGELIKDAITKGFKTINLYVGGSATNDGGIGIASALGFQFYDKSKRLLSPIGKNLLSIDSIDTSEVDFNFNNIEINVICDVNNPLYGENGAAFIYAKQKGADSIEIEQLNKGLVNLQSMLIKHGFPNIANIPGSGSAGGVGGGMIAFLEAKLISGIQNLIKVTQLENIVKDCDLIITGEGKIDNQTEKGKVVSGVCNLARKYKKPIIAVCGNNDDNISKKLGIKKVYTILERSDSINDAIVNVEKYLIEIGFELIHYIKKKP
jgi:glycerate kinase